MTALSDHAADYLQLRRALGHKLADAHRLLPRFVAYLDAVGARHLQGSLGDGSNLVRADQPRHL